MVQSNEDFLRGTMVRAKLKRLPRGQYKGDDPRVQTDAGQVAPPADELRCKVCGGYKPGVATANRCECNPLARKEDLE